MALLSFVVALALSCVLLHSLLPLPWVPQVSEKLRAFEQTGDEYDTLFVGSSRVRRQISPEVFDQRMRELGMPTRSYNFGIDAMTSPELLYVLERILEKRPKQLKHVVMDLNPLRRRVDRKMDEDGVRSIYWHNLKYTALVLNAVLHDAEVPSRSERCRTALAHAAMFLKNYANLGRGARQFLELGKPNRLKDQEFGEGLRGFFPVDAPMPEQQFVRYRRDLIQKADTPQPVLRARQRISVTI